MPVHKDYVGTAWPFPAVPTKAKGRRGFASMDPARQREIASQGGKAAHIVGTAHEFTPEEARRAAQRSVEVRAAKRAARRAAK